MRAHTHLSISGAISAPRGPDAAISGVIQCVINPQHMPIFAPKNLTGVTKSIKGLSKRTIKKNPNNFQSQDKFFCLLFMMLSVCQHFGSGKILFKIILQTFIIEDFFNSHVC